MKLIAIDISVIKAFFIFISKILWLNFIVQVDELL